MIEPENARDVALPQHAIASVMLELSSESKTW